MNLILWIAFSILYPKWRIMRGPGRSLNICLINGSSKLGNVKSWRLLRLWDNCRWLDLSIGIIIISITATTTRISYVIIMNLIISWRVLNNRLIMLPCWIIAILVIILLFNYIIKPNLKQFWRNLIPRVWIYRWPLIVFTPYSIGSYYDSLWCF